MRINFRSTFAFSWADFCLTLPGFARRATALVAPIAVCVAATMVAKAQGPPILNSPYICANGITYTVTICKPYRADQWCETTETQNGRLVTTMDSSWSSMTGRLQGCTNAAAGKPASSPPSAPATAPAQPASGAQQTFNPPYLKEFPTVDQIMAQVKGSSAQDTAYRQLTALHEFAQMIAALAGPRMQQNKLTADEARILTNYFNAYTALAKATPNPQDAYAGKNDFTASLFQIFHMPTIQQLWETGNKITASQQGGGNTQSTLPPTTDPATLSARRCVELGGSAMQCLGGALSTGLQQLIGINLDAMTNSGKTGLVLYGTYNGSAGLHFDFSDANVDIGGCGQMVKGAHGYSLGVTGGELAVKIDNQPQPLAMTLGVDKKMAGPAMQQITGQKVVGYFVETNLKTGASTRTPNYGPDTENCKIGSLMPGPATAPDQGFLATLGNALTDAEVLAETAPAGSASQQNLIAPGPRIAGVFKSATGLKIQFQDASAVIDCAQAHVVALYDVYLKGGAANITVKNGASPILLALQANGSLTGTGSTTINGKLMTGMDDSGNPILAPTSASCPVDTLTAAK
jgi:hypothetical protein